MAADPTSAHEARTRTGPRSASASPSGRAVLAGRAAGQRDAGGLGRAAGDDRRDDRARAGVAIGAGLDAQEGGAADVDRVGAVAAVDLLGDRKRLVDRDRVALVAGGLGDVVD